MCGIDLTPSRIVERFFKFFPDILFLVDPKILVTGSSGHIKESAPGVDTAYTRFSEIMFTGSETELFGLELVWCVSGNS